MNREIADLIYKFVLLSRNERSFKLLSSFMENERKPIEQLENIRFIKAKSLLIHSLETVPYYREKINFKPDEVEKLNESEFEKMWKEIPFTTKEDFINFRSEFISTRINKMKCYKDRTSGSTGTPIEIYVNAECWAVRHARDLQFKVWHKIRSGEKYFYFWGEHWSKRSKIKNRIRDYLLNRRRVSAFNMNPDYLQDCYSKIISFKPSYIFGYPSAIFDFCAFVKGLGRDLKHLNIKAILTTAEPLRDYQRNLIEETFRCGAFSQYGGAEQGFVSAECEDKGFHIFIDTCWLEGDEKNSSGDSVEAVATDLHLWSMPLIRYKTGDEIIFKSGSCSCGRNYPLLERVEGRKGEPIILPNGKRINANLPSYIFKHIASKGIIRRYRFVDKKDGILRLVIVPSNKFTKEDENAIINETKRALGEDLKVNVELVEQVENLPNAKHRDYVVINEK